MDLFKDLHTAGEAMIKEGFYKLKKRAERKFEDTKNEGIKRFSQDTDLVVKDFKNLKNLNSPEDLRSEFMKGVNDIIAKTTHPSVVVTKDNPEDFYSYFLSKKAAFESEEDRIVRNMVENILDDLGIPLVTVRYVVFPGDELPQEWSNRVDQVCGTFLDRVDNTVEKLFLEHGAKIIDKTLTYSEVALDKAKQEGDVFSVEIFEEDLKTAQSAKSVSDEALELNQQEREELQYPEPVEYLGNTVITSHVDEVLSTMGVRPTLTMLMRLSGLFMDKDDMARSSGPKSKKGPQPQ